MRIGKRRVLAMVMGSLAFAGCTPEAPPTIETIQSAVQALDSSSSWIPATHMKYARQEHAALKLKDGHVLVVGGTADPSETAESYDPETDEWITVTAPSASIISTKSGCRPAMVQIDDGTDDGGPVIVVSTNWDTAVSTVSIFEPSNSKWTSIYDLPSATCSPSVVRLAKDRALILADDATNTEIFPFIYKHESKTVEPTTALPAPKEGSWIESGVIRLNDGRVLVSGGGIGVSAVNNESIVYDASDPNTWIHAGDMVIGRALHALALLPNGNVLAVGGYAVGPYTAPWSETAEIFDIKSMSWGSAPPMANARVLGHTATLLDSGVILTIGGSTSSTAELFDPSTNQWTPLESPDDVRYYHHSSTLLDNGRILVTGGALTDESDDASLCDALAFAWESRASLSKESRGFHSATELDDGTLLVVGGTVEDLNESLQSVQDAWIYNSEQNTWNATNSPSFPRGLHTATKLLDGRVLVAGGMDESAVVSEIFDSGASTNTWTNIASLPVPIKRAAATLLNDGRVLHIGGIYSGGANLTADEVLLYDLDSNAWTSAPDLPENPQRVGHSVTLLDDGTVLVAGGFASCPVGGSESSAVATVARYDPLKNTWSSAKSMTQARAFHSATRLRDGRVLVAGGGGEIINDCLRPTWYSVHTTTEIYNPAANTWTPAGSLNEARTEHQAVLLESGNVLIGGGRRNTNRIHSSAELFDSNDKTWTRTSRFQKGRYGHSLTLLEDGVIAIGGFHPFPATNVSVERYPQAELGDSCSLDDQCKSKYCANDVCCDMACNSQCMACSKNASNINKNAKKTLGEGYCEDVSGCSPFACTEETGTCGETCKSVDDCAIGYVCDPTFMCIKPSGNASRLDDSSCTATASTNSESTAWPGLVLVAGALALRRHRRVHQLQRKS